MARKVRTEEEDAQIDMTPMLDIVFIMLIFFIVTASFVRESGIEVNKPEDSNSPPPDQVDEDKRAIAFIIDNNNRITHDFVSVDISSVSSIIKKESVERPEAPVVIQTAEGAHTGIAIRIYDAAQDIGIPRDKIVWTPRK